MPIRAERRNELYGKEELHYSRPVRSPKQRRGCLEGPVQNLGRMPEERLGERPESRSPAHKKIIWLLVPPPLLPQWPWSSGQSSRRHGSHNAGAAGSAIRVWFLRRAQQ